MEAAAPAVFDTTDFKFTQRMAKRILPAVLDELDEATEAGRLNNSWSRDVIMAIRE
eukprot:CAMPEP_0197425080 /NCGR_PEP_ID=MMETSP1170-20131217/29310_1 /TAXON_ID=54406 /ORGANISM="Sarcinochrysis sp, Strain CCMP770" /LENGTH=55 /DNA_ID=CAMNT_0042952609 /DNA_START=1 /DNA_END=165 /DNA_ORIENTATION=+